MTASLPNRLLTSNDPEFWSRRVGVMFETSFAEEVPFEIAVKSTHLERMIISDMRTSAFHFARRKPKVRADMLDHFMLRVDDRGGSSTLNIVDFGQALETFEPISAHNVSLIMPRDIVLDAVPDAETLHATAPDDPGATLLKECILALSRNAAGLRHDQAEAAAKAMLDLMSATLRSKAPALDRARTALAAAARQRVLDFVRQNLSEPRLAPGFICERLGMSRSALYRLFEPTGGVAAHILERRLELSYRLLNDAQQNRLISDIAHTLCFSSESAFSRAFRQRFGITPRDLRAAARLASRGTQPHASPHTEQSFAAWLQSL
ncbi:AraC family transcriptional regulator [Devosia pacifica]|uniref:AraC family transcriptional regulator n=1 Tax=Devosia pacifica TaxID=1335967 RepID=A0A918VTG8_9HYPH|nr:AraC family transcriptional regulator [Devosia pacifica]GHA23863.1 AraC family transcriptional regulator [Devosia pacifica]